MAHAWVGRERQREGEAAAAAETPSGTSRSAAWARCPASLFDGFSYVALGHLHGQQTLADHVRYSGSPLPYSFSETDHKKGSWLVEVGADGKTRAERVPHRSTGGWPSCAAPSKTCSRQATRRHEDDFLAVTLTDAARPEAAMDRLRRRFPHVLTLEFRPEGVTADSAATVTGSGRDDLTIAAEFVRHVRNTEASPREHELLAAAFTAARDTRQRDPRGRPLMRPHRLRVRRSARSPGPSRSPSTTWRDCSCCTARPARARPRCSTRSRSPYTAGCRGSGAAPSGCAPTTQPPCWRPRWSSRRPSAAGGCGSPASRSRNGRRNRAPASPGSRPRCGWRSEPLRARWEGKSIRVVEADQEIGDLMGMSADQFFQVVLLPQGQFAQFLHADAKDEEALLQKLFGTDRFRAVERWLADRRLRHREGGGRRDRGPRPPDRPGRPGGRRSRARRAPDAGHGHPDAWLAGLAANGAAEQDAGRRSSPRASADWSARSRPRARPSSWPAASAAAGRPSPGSGHCRRRPGDPALRAEADAALRAAEVEADLDAADRAAGRRPRAARRRRGPGRRSRTGRKRPADCPRRNRGDAAAAAEEQRAQLGRLDALRAVARQAADEDKPATAARNRAARSTRSWPRRRPGGAPGAGAPAGGSRRATRPARPRPNCPPRRPRRTRPAGGGRLRRPGHGTAKAGPPARGAPGRAGEGRSDVRDGPGRPRGAHRRHERGTRRQHDRRQPLPGLRLTRSSRSGRAHLRAGQPRRGRSRQRARRPGRRRRRTRQARRWRRRTADRRTRATPRQAGFAPLGRRRRTRPTSPRRHAAAASAAAPADAIRPPPRGRPAGRPGQLSDAPGRPTPTRSASRPRPPGWRRDGRAAARNASLTSSTTPSPPATPGGRADRAAQGRLAEAEAAAQRRRRAAQSCPPSWGAPPTWTPRSAPPAAGGGAGRRRRGRRRGRPHAAEAAAAADRADRAAARPASADAPRPACSVR